MKLGVIVQNATQEKTEEALNQFYELIFNKGYIPMEATVIIIDPKYNYPFSDGEKYKRITTRCAYAGKKQARKIGVQKKPNISDIKFNNPYERIN